MTRDGLTRGVTAVLLAAVTLLFVFAGYAYLGDSLGLPIYLCFVAPVAAIPLVTRDAPLRFALGTAALLGLVAGLPMLAIGPWRGGPSFVALLVSLAACGVAVGRLLTSLRVPDAVARAVTVAALLAWLTWPIWLGIVWTRPAVAPWLDKLVAVQPVLAANGAYAELGEWAHQPIAYKYLTNLGQDVFYAMPRSAWRAAALHAAVALLAAGATEGVTHLSLRRERKAEDGSRPADPAA